jgi:MATE family multidrug resistance protein
LGLQLDGIFVGSTRTGTLHYAMAISLVAFIAVGTALVAELGNHGLWLSFLLFMATRGLTLAAYYPALERSLAIS